MPPPSGSPKVIDEVVKCLDRVAAYLEDIIVFDSDPAAHIDNISALLERFLENNITISPAKAKSGTIEADFLGHTFSPTCGSPDTDEAAAFTSIPHADECKAGPRTCW